MKTKTQADQVIEAMRRNGGYATFGQLNTLVNFSQWETKTPQATVRRIVQKNNAFFKIQPGLWALQEYKKTVLDKFQLKTRNERKDEMFTHSYYQGLLIEIGNMKQLATCVPPQDKNHLFLEKPLAELVSLGKIYDFTYPELLRRATTVDVIWFNERKLPNSFFEVEHSTDIQNSLVKFFELQDYSAKFKIVADESREKQFSDLLQKSIFRPIKERVFFLGYKRLVALHEKMSALEQLKQSI
ncbi:MAG: hypothetical protein LBM92_00465 [Opitutaceae bacterium]|jgi:hypothetical protein|nr:hypothetical protein [Opitutaceae bacterium]